MADKRFAKITFDYLCYNDMIPAFQVLEKAGIEVIRWDVLTTVGVLDTVPKIHQLLNSEKVVQIKFLPKMLNTRFFVRIHGDIILPSRWFEYRYQLLVVGNFHRENKNYLLCKSTKEEFVQMRAEFFKDGRFSVFQKEEYVAQIN